MGLDGAVGVHPAVRHHPGDVVVEGLQVGRGLEADEVVGHQRAHQAAVIDQDGEDFRRREGGVQEEADAPVAAQLAQLLAERDQVIVLHPHDVAVLEQRHQPFGEQLVDLVVVGEVVALEHREVGAVMEHRPQGLVGEALVVAAIVIGVEVGGGKGDAVALVALHRPRLARHRLAAPAEPQAPVVAQRRLHGDREAARRRLGRFRRHPVRHHHQSVQGPSSPLGRHPSRRELRSLLRMRFPVVASPPDQVRGRL
jgi:hypothetical protein